MVITKKMEESFNRQINAELYSAYIYLAMSSAMADANFMGASKWFQVQAKEEVGHAMKMFHFVVERGGRVTLSDVKGPQNDYASVLAAFKQAYEHEQKVTQLIHDLVKAARAENDTASEVFLQWFVTEQVEEESNAKGIVDRATMIGDSKSGLLYLDKELGKRE